MTLMLGIALALACALTTNVGFLFKHRGACAAPAVDIRHPLRSARALFSSKLFAIGMLIASGAWIFHVGAMAIAPLSVVQSVLAGGVVLLAVMAERAFGLSISRRQWLGISLTAVGLVLLGLSLPAVARRALALLGPRHDRLRGRPAARRLADDHGAADRRSRRSTTASCSARPPGLLFGVSDVSIKAISGMVHAHGAIGLLSPWTGGHDRRLDRRLLRLGQGAAGWRGRPGDRGHRHRGQRLGHRRRDHRVRRPAVRPPAAP